MKLKPVVSAGLAALYIVGIVGVIQYLTSFGKEGDGEDIILIPMVMLSLLVLSVLVMGFLFAFRPLELYIEGQRSEAIRHFLTTVGLFAICAVGFVLGYVYVMSTL
jgi:hypothetical protein